MNLSNAFQCTSTWYLGLCLALAVHPGNAQSLFDSAAFLAEGANNPQAVHAADLDGDGDLDALAVLFGADAVVWYENVDGWGAFGPQRIVASDVPGPIALHAEDLDGDGDADVLVTSPLGGVVWYENLGSDGSFGEQQVIDAALRMPLQVVTADVDGDGDPDVLSSSSSDDRVVWYENREGSGRFGARRVITGRADAVRDVVPADLDGDGDLDVVVASYADVSWYPNCGGPRQFGARQVISREVDWTRDVLAVDLDGDEDLDVVSASFWDGSVAWYENEGSGRFAAQRVITDEANGVVALAAADFDGNGSVDIIAAARGTSRVDGYVNTGGPSRFGNRFQVATEVGEPTTLYAADFDRDGDADLLVGSRGDATVAWYPNQLHQPAKTSAQLAPEVSPRETVLSAAYPNPFMERTSVSVWLDRTESVRVSIHDLLGRRVAVLHDGVMAGGRRHTFTWVPADLPAGWYVYRVTGETVQASQPVLRIE